jgi:NADPH2:quinone reductase
VRHGAVGLNYIDVYHRSGLYPLPLPSGLGLEAAGTVTAAGDEVTEVAVGDRVAYASPPLGAYAEERRMPADRVVRTPDTIDDQTVAAMMLKGLTAQYLLRRTYRVQPGETILFHAAAGGVGLLACQWASHLGATVIGTVGSAEKAELALAHGCDHVIDYSREDIVERVMEITAGAGVPVVYDSVGQATWDASGPVQPIPPTLLAGKGSLYLTRPTVMDYTADRADLTAGARELFEVVGSGAVRVEVRQTYALADAAQAHRDLEARRNTGSSVLLP